MAVEQGLLGKSPGPTVKAAQPDGKPRGANRSTKVAGKLKVLPDQPDVPTQSKILNEPPKFPTIAEGAKPPTTTDSDEEGEEEDDEPEEPEEQDAEVRNVEFNSPKCLHKSSSCG